MYGIPATPLNTSTSFLIFPIPLPASSAENYFKFWGVNGFCFPLFPFLHLSTHLPGHCRPFCVLVGRRSPQILPSWLRAAESATNWAITHRKASSAAVSKPLPHLGLKKIIPHLMQPLMNSTVVPSQKKIGEAAPKQSVCRQTGVRGREENSQQYVHKRGKKA